MKYSLFRKIFGYNLKEYKELEKEKKTCENTANSLEINLNKKSKEFEEYQKDTIVILNLYEDCEKEVKKELKETKKEIGCIEEILGKNKFQKFMEKAKQINEINFKLENETDANKIIKILENYPNTFYLKNGRGDHKNIYIGGNYIDALPMGKKGSNNYCALRNLRSNIKKVLVKSLFP